LCDLVILSHNLKPNQMRSFGSVRYLELVVEAR